MTHMKREFLTAIHEAGHAVAHIRLGILQELVTIVRAENRLGAAIAEGSESVTMAEAAADQVIAYCAGYAALIAAGFDHTIAIQGCQDDFEHAQNLIDEWSLGGDLVSWQIRSVSMMSSHDNIRAVQLISEWLFREGALDGQMADALVEKSDGNIDEDEFQNFLILHSQAIRPYQS